MKMACRHHIFEQSRNRIFWYLCRYPRVKTLRNAELPWPPMSTRKNKSITPLSTRVIPGTPGIALLLCAFSLLRISCVVSVKFYIQASSCISCLPAACLAFMMAATFSLSADCWEPVLVFLFFYRGDQHVCHRSRDYYRATYDVAQLLLGCLTGVLTLVTTGHLG